MNNDIYDSNVKLNIPVKVIPQENYHLYIEYEDGKTINFDMNNFLNHPLFKPLKEKDFFDLVQINGSSISWPNDIDICADSLYEFTGTSK